MSKTYITIVYLFFIFIRTGIVYAASLDGLYRDIIRSDNQGYLPLFVKNRTEPEINTSKALQDVSEPQKETLKDSTTTPINLTNDRRQKEALKKAKQLRWENTVKAVQQNNVTPLDLEEINYRAGLNDTKAIEILAWMYTKGVGVRQDFITAFKLYKKAETLGVATAGRNAALIYKAMSSEQRAAIKH